jgi:hypothetical protein
VGDCTRYHIEQHHSFDCMDLDADVTRAIASFRLGLCVERRAEIVFASAAVENHQSRYLSRQLGLTRLSKEPFKFKRQFGQCVGEQHGFTLNSNHRKPSTLGSIDITPD